MRWDEVNPIYLNKSVNHKTPVRARGAFMNHPGYTAVAMLLEFQISVDASIAINRVGNAVLYKSHSST